MSVHGRAPHDVFVAPDGDDAAPGTREEPVASLRRARDLLRARPDAERAEHGPVTVWVRGGDYLLPAGLRLTAEDSGTADAPVTWRSCPGERVRLIGGVRVDGFEPWRDEILQTDLTGPLAAAGMDEIPPHLPKRYQVDPDAAPESCELYLDGERQTAARWPNARREPGKAGRWAYVAGVRDDLEWLLEPEGSVFHAGSDRIRAWRHNPEDIQVHVFTNPNWADDVLNLDHVDADAGELWLHPSGPGAGHAHFETGGRFYVKHVLEELDEPGEYYIDRPARWLYFWPPHESAGGLAIVTTAESVVVTDGASHLTLRDFAIQSARGCAVVIRGGSHVTVAGGSIGGAGAWGVLVKGGRNHRVLGCDLCDLGRGGVYLRGGDRFTLERSDHLVHNCDIQRYGRINICYQAGIKLHGVGNRATSCHIHHAGHFGAVIHEGCDNTIERCEIDDVCLEAADAGGIYLYTNWDKGLGNLTMWGNAVRHCLIHDIAGYGMHRPYGLQRRGQFEAYYVTPYACWGIYMDDFASGATISGNIFYRCPLGAIELGGGRGNVIENNIIVDCIPAIHMSSRWHAANHSYPAAGREALEYVGWDRPAVPRPLPDGRGLRRHRPGVDAHPQAQHLPPQRRRLRPRQLQGLLAGRARGGVRGRLAVRRVRHLHLRLRPQPVLARRQGGAGRGAHRRRPQARNHVAGTVAAPRLRRALAGGRPRIRRPRARPLRAARRLARLHARLRADPGRPHRPGRRRVPPVRTAAHRARAPRAAVREDAAAAAALGVLRNRDRAPAPGPARAPPRKRAGSEG